MTLFIRLFVSSLLLLSAVAHAEKITVAAAADLKFAMDDLAATFKKANPGDEIDLVYGSSGKFHTQIQQGAPYDLFFSADIGFPRELAKAGLAASEVKPYAVGRIVLWSASLDATKMTLASLTDPKIIHVAVANPKHAPYGKRAEEALRAAGLWEKIEPKIIYGENIALTAQYAQSGTAQVGIIALALALSPELASKGGYWLIPDNLHAPLEQGYIVTRRADHSALAKRFAAYVDSKPGRAVMTRYGFVLPGEAIGKKKQPMETAQVSRRNGEGFVAGTLIGALGGLIGLGGAEFRLPVLVGVFRLGTLEAIILNNAMSLVVVAAAFIFRANTIPVHQLVAHADVVLNLLAGSLVGAWWAAGHAMTMSRLWLNRIIMVLLVALAALMLSEGWFGLHAGAAALIEPGGIRVIVGLLAGLAIGMVAALLGVAGGELLIPTIVLLFGLDIKLAGSLSLAISLPTMLVGFARYRGSDAFAALRQERSLLRAMAIGSIVGAGLGGMLLGRVSAHLLVTGLGIILLISAVKTFQHAQ